MTKTKKIVFIFFLTAAAFLLVFFGIRVWIVTVKGKDVENSKRLDASIQVDTGMITRYVEIDDAEVVSKENLNLSFELSGKVEEVFFPENSSVKKGDVIIKLETTDMDLEMKGLKASLEKANANLEKVLSGATNESVQIYKGKVNAYSSSVKKLKNVLVDVVKSAYTIGEDAVRGKTNQLFANPNSSNPTLTFSIGDSALESDIESRKADLEEDLNDWDDSAEDLDYSDDLTDAVNEASDYLTNIQSYLDKVAEAVDQLTVAGSGLSQDTIDAWNLAVSTGRTNINSARVSIREAVSNLTGTEGELDNANDSLDFINAKARSEDVRILQSEIDSVNAQIDILNNKIEKAKLKAPADGVIMKILFKQSETVSLFQAAAIFSVYDKKIQADIPEKDISFVEVNKKVEIKLEALASEKIIGSVLSIDPQPINENGDVYYRVNIGIESFIPSIREGMTATVKIETDQKDQILKIPNRYLIMAGTKNFVNIWKNGKEEEVEVEVGSTYEDFVEITKGIEKNSVILMPEY